MSRGDMPRIRHFPRTGVPALLPLLLLCALLLSAFPSGGHCSWRGLGLHSWKHHLRTLFRLDQQRSQGSALPMATPSVDPRLKYRSNITLKPGPANSPNTFKEPFYVSLLLLGNWSSCALPVLTDLLRSLSTPLTPKPDLTASRWWLKLPTDKTTTVAGWWSIVSKSGVTPQVEFLLARHLPKAIAVAQGVAAVRARSSFESSRFVSQTAAQLRSLDSNTVLVVGLGNGAKDPRTNQPYRVKDSSTCGRPMYKSNITSLRGFRGAVVVPKPYAKWDKTCKWGRSMNGCPDADFLATHILAKIADLATSPNAYLPTPPRSLKDYGLWCKNFLSPALCSGGVVCDLRFYSPTAPPPFDPEKLASNAAKQTDKREVNKNLILKPNLVSSNFQFYVQPYLGWSKNPACQSVP